METDIFIADVNVRKLAKGLRMLGFDVEYSNAYTRAELQTLAANENRILLSRNAAIGKEPRVKTFIVQSEDWLVQVRTVIKAFSLISNIKPFTRCLVCNGLLRPVLKESVMQELPEKTQRYFNTFWQCNNCRRVYWKGSHYDRMEKLVEELKRNAA